MHFLLLLYSLSDFTRLNLDLWHSVFLASRFARGVLKTFKCGAIFLLKKKKKAKNVCISTVHSWMDMFTPVSR